MSELKACPICDENAQKFFGYDYGKVGCKNEDCNYSYRPHHPDDWNNRPHENKLKADAVTSAKDHLVHLYCRNNLGGVIETVSYVLNNYANKLERGEL